MHYARYNGRRTLWLQSRVPPNGAYFDLIMQNITLCGLAVVVLGGGLVLWLIRYTHSEIRLTNILPQVSQTHVVEGVINIHVSIALAHTSQNQMKHALAGYMYISCTKCTDMGGCGCQIVYAMHNKREK